MESKKILITGGAGFIGSRISEILSEQGHDVFVVDNLATGSRQNIAALENKENFHFIEGSVLDEALMKEIILGKDEIYHLAAAVGVKQILDKPLNSLLTNIKGAEIVLKEAAENNIKVLITSTSEVCGKGDKMPFKEDDDRTYGSVYNDRWVYAFSKAVDEFLALAYWREKQLPVVVVRLFNVIGPRQTGAYGMVAPAFVKQALAGEPMVIFGNPGIGHGEQTRCFADIDDIAPALIKLMATEQARGQVTNLGTDQEISINNLVKEIQDAVEEITGVRPPEPQRISYVQAYPRGYEDFERRVPDLTKAKALIGYQPKVCLKESIRKIIQFQRAAK